MLKIKKFLSDDALEFLPSSDADRQIFSIGQVMQTAPRGDARASSGIEADDFDTMIPPDRAPSILPEAQPVAGEQSFGLTPSSAALQEVYFLTGVNANGTLNGNSFWGLNGQTAHKWGSGTAGTSGGTITYYFDTASNFTQTERTTFREAFALWSSVANVQFAETSSQTSASVLLRRGSDGRAYESDQGHVTTGSGSTLGTHNGQSLISIDTSVTGFDLSGSFDVIGGYGFQTVIHEIGHFLGLGHGGNYNGNVNPATQQSGPYDERSWTLMSYIYWGNTNAQYRSSYELTGTNWGTTSDGYAHQSSGTFMPLDILAIQQLYGAPANSASPGFYGNQVFGFNSTVGSQTSGALLAPFYDFTVNRHPVVTIYSQGTNNTLDLSGFTSNSTINLSPGSYSSADNMVNNIAIAYGTTVETAIGGTGNDRITGTSGNNVLIGGLGQDTLTGSGGNDIFRGTAAQLSGDTITDFSALDVIHVTNAGSSVQALQYNGTTLSFQLASTGAQTYSMTLPGGTAGGVTQVADSSGGVDIMFGSTTGPGSVSIGDVQFTEGDSGLRAAFFTVTRTGGTAPFTINYATADGTATAGSDYIATSGSFTFGEGVMSASQYVVINGDTTVEPDETLFVNLSGATNGAVIARSQGTITIVNDDGQTGTVTISDVSITEGNAGTSIATFTVGRSGGTNAFAVNYATADGTATAGSDYVATSGTLNFAAGVTLQTISVTINGDTVVEPNETFFVNLSGATNGATIADGQGIGTIVNDDVQAGSIAISDVSIVEGNTGTSVATFTVTRSGGTAAFAVNYATANGTATAGSDYVATAGTLSFAAGVTSQTVSVTINGDTVLELNETFFVNLSGATNGATIADAQGVGTILNDDVRDDFADSFTDTTAPFGTLAAGRSATGELEIAGDRDWFRVQLTAGARYVIDLSGADTNRGSLADPLLRLYDATGALITANDDDGPGLDSQLIYTATASGTYYVEAGAYFDGYTGTYRVGVSGDVTADPDGMPLVDDRFYNARYPDVAAAGVDPERHYGESGWHEGRDPNAFFSTTGYLAANADVRAAGFNPLTHYDSNGWREGRDPSAAFDNELYLARNPDVAQAGIDPLAHFLASGQAEGRQAYAAIGQSANINAAHGFDAEYYLLNNADVARAAIGAGGDSFAFAAQHYQTFGWHEGRNPNAVFDVAGYLATYGDVRAANIDPLAHYDSNGWREGRDPSANFDTRAYEARYADVAAAGIDPMTHYLTSGIYEGRSAFADGHFG